MMQYIDKFISNVVIVRKARKNEVVAIALNFLISIMLFYLLIPADSFTPLNKVFQVT